MSIVHYYAKKNNIPYIVQAHGSVMPTFQKTFLKKLFDKLWGNNILKDASNLIALTETESEQYKLMGIFENKITIVPNGINLLDYQKIPKKGEFRKKYNIKNNEKIILYLGRIHKNKGIELLLDAFSIVLENDEKFRLVIVGPDDGFLDHIKELTKTLNLNKNVLFTGPIYENDKAEVYVDSDIFVTPSYSGLPITFLESCAYGIPIITTSNGDKLDWINNNVGYVVKYDKYLLSNAILNLISNESLKNKFGYNGKTLVRTNFNWEIITQYIEKIYHEIIG
jgi:glycosyltransferase involved in cell wall biosynthesis